jgi:hypothetical protein
MPTFGPPSGPINYEATAVGVVSWEYAMVWTVRRVSVERAASLLRERTGTSLQTLFEFRHACFERGDPKLE